MMSYRARRIDGEVGDLVVGCGLLVVVPNNNATISLLRREGEEVEGEVEEVEEKQGEEAEGEEAEEAGGGGRGGRGRGKGGEREEVEKEEDEKGKGTKKMMCDDKLVLELTQSGSPYRY